MNGEGTIDVAPNGDIVGIGWGPYSGDHLQAFKYEAFSGRWFYAEQPLHTPFYDREWVTVVLGPFSIDGARHHGTQRSRRGVIWSSCVQPRGDWPAR